MIAPKKVGAAAVGAAVVIGLAACGAAKPGFTAPADAGAANKSVGGPNVYAGMSDEEILAYDQKVAADHERQLAAYVVAHRSSLENSLGTLPVREPLASMRALGPTLPDAVLTASVAILGHVDSVSIADDGSITGHVRVDDVGKHGDSGIASGQVIDVHQIAHLDLDGDSPVIVAPAGLPSLLAGQDGIYFLTKFDFGLAASYGGAVLPVRNGVVAAASSPIAALVAGRSAADVLADVRGLAGD